MPTEEDRTRLTEKLLASVEARAKAVWGDLSELVKVEVKEAMEDLANLTLAQLQTPDEALKKAIDMELRHARARLGNWTFVGADLVRDAVKATLKDLAETLGAFLKGILR